MKKSLPILVIVSFLASGLAAQVEPGAGSWKTWFISSGKSYRLGAPPSYKEEITDVLLRQQNLDSAGWQQIMYWNAGAPGYHWQEMMTKLWQTDTSLRGALANLLMNVSIYDATIAAWDTKYSFKRRRPFMVDKRINSFVISAESPSYPCEYSVAAGAAVFIISHFYPAMADSAKRMADQLMASRVAAGMAFPSDTRAGFELGKRIAEKEIGAKNALLPAT
ncbi:MAG TPA: phosphatase PAP2 family protein, partial [Flavisolibacter sp.]|nr:phosphatase PAP2 family protein [Flavisolibacter sp.]